MANRAYVLIETSIGKTRDVVTALRKVSGITSVDVVTGPYDVIAVVEAANLDAIGELVTRRVHNIPGVERTVTCLSVSLP